MPAGRQQVSSPGIKAKWLGEEDRNVMGMSGGNVSSIRKMFIDERAGKINSDGEMFPKSIDINISL